jgi:cysteine sulfinate desulfinase/cysteine desulfurase-like protein
MGLDPQLAHGSLRMTVGRATTAADIARSLEATRAAVERLRGAVAPRAAASA